MPPSDKNKPTENSVKEEDPSENLTKSKIMDLSSEIASSSSSDVTQPGQGMVAIIPLSTACLPTLKCSINDQRKTFDPGENGGNEGLASVPSGNLTSQGKSSNSNSSSNSSKSSLKSSTKNYKAGSKINKLADMLAKRSQNVVEVTQSSSSDVITNIISVPKVEGTVVLNKIVNIINFDKSVNNPSACSEKTAIGKEIDLFKKSRRKSVPNQSCNIQRLQLQSTSKSCSDFSKLFPMEGSNKHDFNALGESLTKLQTEESTKSKVVKKNLKNVELPLILPERKRRYSMRNVILVNNKVIEKILDISPELINESNKNPLSTKEIITSSISTPIRSVISSKVKKENKVKQRKSKRLVENSTQTMDLEFVNELKPKVEVTEKPEPEDTTNAPVVYKCLHCSETFDLESEYKSHEKTHLQKNNKQVPKCQYCSKKLLSLDKLKSHCVQKHPDKCAYCVKCDERFTAKEELYLHNKEAHLEKNESNVSQNLDEEDSSSVLEKPKPEVEGKPQNDKKVTKHNGTTGDLKIDVSYDSSKKSSVSPRNVQKISPKDSKTEEQLLEMEMLFYSHLSGNIQENLMNHLDGKIDKSGSPMRNDQVAELADNTQVKVKSSNLLSVITSNTGVPDVQVSRAPSPYQTRSKTPNPLPPTAKKFKKLPNWQQKFWEKYNFPTNYRFEHRFWDKNYLNTEKSAFYLKDLSCLDIKTQLTMRENIKKLDSIKIQEENSKADNKLTFPEYLSLIPRVNGGNSQENKVDSLKRNSDQTKNKKQNRKEEIKKSFRSPAPELPTGKTRKKFSSENSSLNKRFPEKTGEEVTVMTRSQSSTDLMRENKDDGGRKRKGSLDVLGSQKMTLRRQTSLDNIQGFKNEKNFDTESNINSTNIESSPLSPAGSTEITGEWVRPRSYLCGTCCAKFTNLWELEDHKWVSHPNVWCTHYEFEDEKIYKLFQKNEESEEGNIEDSSGLSKLKLTDLYKRYLLPQGSLKTAKLVPSTNFPEQCTKCKKNCLNSSEMHKHMLDCGGDTTWFLTMYSSPMTIKRKWRPFGSRRRKQIGKRDLKRNIPSTPALRSYHYQHRIRTKPGDVESIQKMLANLPEKRARRAINFDEIKTRSQATIHSNRLLRKRFKSSFGNNFLKLKNFKQKRPLKHLKKEGNSKSTTDVSSESTPTGSPKRRNKVKEASELQPDSRDGSRESSVNPDSKYLKKKGRNKKKEPQLNSVQEEKPKDKTEKIDVKKDKSVSKKNSVSTIVNSSKSSTKNRVVKKELLVNTKSCETESNANSQPGVSKCGKKIKKKKYKKPVVAIDRNDIAKLLSNPCEDETKEVTYPKTEKRIRTPTDKKWANTQTNSILRLKQCNKEKTELLKRIKKKFQKSKKILEKREEKKANCGSRRSLRLKSLQLSEECADVAKETNESSQKKEDSSCQRDLKLKKPIINLESTIKKSPRASIEKSPKGKEQKSEIVNSNENLGRKISPSKTPVDKSPKGKERKPEIKNPEESLIKKPSLLKSQAEKSPNVKEQEIKSSEEVSGRKLSPSKTPPQKISKVKEQKPDISVTEEASEKKSFRSLRNSLSFEEKSEILAVSGCVPNGDNVRKMCTTRRNSRSVSETPEIIDNITLLLKKSPRIQSIQNLRTSEEKQNSVLPNGQISLLKNSRLQNSNAKPKNVNSEECKKLILPNSSDLAEMPILAKVEPIRGKLRKAENEIPVLLPVEKEQKEESGDEMAMIDDNTVSFQVIRKRKSTSKEITPLKIVKKVENIPVESKNCPSKRFQLKEADVVTVDDNSEIGRSKRKKIVTDPVLEKTESENKTEVKKYFLGICPSEIDKGRKESREESGSDSEPLISLVNKQLFKGNKITDTDSKEEVASFSFVDTEKNETPHVKRSKKKNKKKKKKGAFKKKVVESPLFLDPPLLKAEVIKDEEKETTNEIQVERSTTTLPKTVKIKKKRGCKKKKKILKKDTKGLLMTVTLKEATLKLPKDTFSTPSDNKWELKAPELPVEAETKPEPPCLKSKDVVLEDNRKNFIPERRSRRISKETKSSDEFVIDDPLILVDELWSDLDSDSDSSKKKTKKGRRKKKVTEKKPVNDVNLEELLRNFGENKELNGKKNESVDEVNVKRIVKHSKMSRTWADIRKIVENRKEMKSYKRLSLKLFRFNKFRKNFGNGGEKLWEAKKAAHRIQAEIKEKENHLPDLPFLAAEIKENPVQVIQCGTQKTKTGKRGIKKEGKSINSDIQLKISLPLESITNMTVFNNNHLTELIVEEPAQITSVSEDSSSLKMDKKLTSQIEELPIKETFSKGDEIQETSSPTEPLETNETKYKPKRSEVIDKIFYCEICKTYYYSASQLKIHKLSNRHKVKESEILLAQQQPEVTEKTLLEIQQELIKERILAVENLRQETPSVPDNITEEPAPVVENIRQELTPVPENIMEKPAEIENNEGERSNDDNLEMPTLEGPFIENPLTRVELETNEPVLQPPVVNTFDFSQENLKDIQRAIGCTDEEMLILTLLGENTIEIENDILDLDPCKPVQAVGEDGAEKVGGSVKEIEKANGTLKLDLKQRMTSALACLVNKAVLNLLHKYETAAKSAVNPEALTLLGKLSNLNRRKNILQLNELLKSQNDGNTSIDLIGDMEKKEPILTYKYQCTICGSRFEKASTRECHISRSHKGKAKKVMGDVQISISSAEEDWNDSWSYDVGDDHVGSDNMSQFWCSDCGINFLSPQEVFEHQKLEHKAGLKTTERAKEAGPLQSSTIGSSDEIIEGKKPRRRPKVFSSEELDQQRIIANNELRKLDRKFSGKNKSNKIKWGMDALRFTVEKENKVFAVPEEKEMTPEETEKPSVDVKNIDLVPKLNLSRTSSVPEFKVIQRNSFKNRFQKIIDNKLKRKSNHSQQEPEIDDIEEEVMLVPVVVKKKNKKQKTGKYVSKKEEEDKPLDVYDFNESESDGEPVMFSHKKQVQSPTKMKLVKLKEGPSKNKADSTTKDLAPDDYDSEDSLPLSIVKKSKPEEEDEEKDGKISEDGLEKSENILEQVEYLIEQLEHETATSNKQSDNKKSENSFESKEEKAPKFSKDETLKEDLVYSVQDQEDLRVSVASKFLQLEGLPLKTKVFQNFEEQDNISLETEKNDETPVQEDNIVAEPESSQSTFDEEDSMPLVLMSKKVDEAKANEEKKCDENTTDVSTTASEDTNLFKEDRNKRNDTPTSVSNFPIAAEESLPPVFSLSENEGVFNEKSEKAFENLNGNVIYCRNDSISEFGSDLSTDELSGINFEKINIETTDQSFVKEITEKKDVVIVCSKGSDREGRTNRKKVKGIQRGRKENPGTTRRRRKRFPLLTATIEENNFRKSESPKLNKEEIVKKIWSRRKLAEESTDNDEESLISLSNENSTENVPNDESQSEVEKEVIVKKIWSRKKVETDEDLAEKAKEKSEDLKINKTEISDEVVIKCGPKTKTPMKRRKSRNSTNESSKETIMRKIWSGKCAFQTKAALKTYDSDVILNCKENDNLEEQTKPKKRGRPSGLSSAKRSKTDSEFDKDDEDDLDSLLEEIEREQLEKAIRLEFLQMRRSEKANVEILKEGSNSSVGLFTESTTKPKKEVTEKKKRKVKRNIKHPRKSLLQRKKYLKKPIRRVRATEEAYSTEGSNRTNTDGCVAEQSETSFEKTSETFDVETKMKNRKHKKHRHKHHHHRHKHKKSKHRKCIINKHKSKHKLESEDVTVGNSESFDIFDKICEKIPNQIESEIQFPKSRTPGKESELDLNLLESKIDEVLSPFPFENKVKDCSEDESGHRIPEKSPYDAGIENVYEFIEDIPD